MGVPRLGGDRYILKDNLLYLADTENPRLVVPSKRHEMILHLGHTVPWSGHLGQQKTYDRISQRLYSECQMVASVCKADRSYLQPLPIIGIPFARIGMDIIGP